MLFHTTRKQRLRTLLFGSDGKVILATALMCGGGKAGKGKETVWCVSVSLYGSITEYDCSALLEYAWAMLVHSTAYDYMYSTVARPARSLNRNSPPYRHPTPIIATQRNIQNSQDSSTHPPFPSTSSPVTYLHLLVIPLTSSSYISPYYTCHSKTSNYKYAFSTSIRTTLPIRPRISAP
jgi:hypothetical protein